ncbi:OmpA family protein [Spirochaeta isovalerica]|uniref:Outer membrane protein OmpA-like peptidoglycan-associated protein n=1 Tax=Spirochaeta isovalerica TaxID=150 RepID=A0A841R6K5_9SPIO|nr:OmpA family protein [Spirochaeta isovalerica]MBB6479485.1 outer membrane protein OmpA-like peptidoglycan-associated protein [Spirochaeta isovalerica]
MRVRLKRAIISLLLVLPFGLNAVEFRFTYEEGDHYRIVTEVSETVKENDKIIYSTEILNRIAATVTGVTDGRGDIEALYQISEHLHDGSGYQWSSEDEVAFTRDAKGVYSELPVDTALPSVRNVPRFPDQDIAIGESWNFSAEEVHDLLPFFGIDYRLHIPFRVFYTYDGTVQRGDKVLDKITIIYHIYYEQDPVLTVYEHPDWGDEYPEKIVGSFYQEYFWNREAGRPAEVEDRFEYKYYLSTGVSYTFSGVSKGKVVEAREMDREQMAEDISRELEEEGIDDIAVTSDEEGVRLTLEEIRFLPDSPVLEDSEIGKLERISEILMRYRDRDILVEGHTARFGTEESCQILSEERAAAVASYFQEMHIRDESEIVTRGYGSTRPLGSNLTEEGQRLNRRVEITILEN